MAANKQLLLLPGDGIGPEVMRQVAPRHRLDGRRRGARPSRSSDGLVGGCAYDHHGAPLTDETMAAAMRADAVLLGAVGGPKWDGRGFDKRPERGLLRLRKEMGLFANLRPAHLLRRAGRCLVPEARGGRGPRHHDRARADRRRLFRRAARHRGPCQTAAAAASTPRSTPRREIERVARVAFELARGARTSVCLGREVQRDGDAACSGARW